MTAPAVSILLTTYRAAPYLRTYLQSVAKLSPALAYELVAVVNVPDGAEVQAWCEWRPPPHVTLQFLPLRQRTTCPESMNLAARHATAPVFAWWNVDDLRYPDSLARQLTRLQATGADLCHGSYDVAHQYGGPCVAHEARGQYESPHPALLDRCVTGPFWCWTRALHERIGGFDESLPIVNDYAFAMAAARCARIVACPDSLGIFTDAGQGVSTDPARRAQHEREHNAVRRRYGLLPWFPAREAQPAGQ